LSIDRGGGLDVAGGIKVLPGEREPGAAGELREEGPLRPPVALAERVQGVDLAQLAGQSPDERVAAQAAQATSSCSSRKMMAAGESMYCGRQNMAPLAMVLSSSLLHRTPVTGSLYGSPGIYGYR
jgi:hypothetical protein